MHLVNLPHPRFFHYQPVGRQGIFLEYLNSFTRHDSNIKINHLLDCVCISEKPSRGEQISRGPPVKSHGGASQMQTRRSVSPSSRKASLPSRESLDACCAEHGELWRAKFPGGKLQGKSFRRKETYLQAREVKVCEQHPVNKGKIGRSCGCHSTCSRAASQQMYSFDCRKSGARRTCTFEIRLPSQHVCECSFASKNNWA